MEKTEFLKSKKSTTAFAIIALFGGFFFLNKSVTGNTIINHEYTYSLLPTLGLALILCAVILAIYTVMKKE